MALGQQTQQLFESFERIPESAARGELQREQLEGSRQQREVQREQEERLKFKSAFETFNAMQKIFSSNLTEKQLQEIKKNPERGMELVDEFREGNAVADKAMLDLGFERGSLGTFMTRQGKLGGKTRTIITGKNQDTILQKIANRRNVPVESLSPDEAPIGGALETFISDSRDDFIVKSALGISEERWIKRKKIELESKRLERTGKAIENLRLEFPDRIKEERTSLKNLSGLVEQVRSGNPFLTEAIRGPLARQISQEVGVLTDADIGRVTGSKAAVRRLKRFAEQIRTGKFQKEDQEELLSALELMESVNQKKIEFELKRVAKTTANFFQGVDANDLIEKLRPELDFQTGTFLTESPVQKSEQRTLESVRAENPDKEIAMNNGVISEIIRDANGNPIMARRIQ